MSALQECALTSSLIELLTKPSTAADWIAKGRDLFHANQYESALLYFERGGDQTAMIWCQALLLVLEADK